MKRKLNIYLILLLTITLSSCHFTNDIESDDDNNFSLITITSHYKVLKNISHTFSMINYYLNNDSILDSTTITIEPSDSTYPKTITINFGNGTQCFDGFYRKGKITVSLTGPWNLNEIQDSTTLTAELDNYYYKSPEDDNYTEQIGNFAISFLHFSNNKPVYVIDFFDNKLIFSNNEEKVKEEKEIYWNSSHVVTWQRGFSDISNFLDNKFVLWGSSNGNDIEGSSYYTEMIDSLYFSGNCHDGQITKGRLKLVKEGFQAQTVYFGDGSCNNILIVTSGNNQVTLNI
jgi:hypothetical protein